MFTVEQIKEAHSKVQSGADFPVYIRALKALGLTSYDTFVADGHADYYGAAHDHVSSAPLYDRLLIAETADSEHFKADLKTHQEGGTDYFTFCQDAAKCGIAKWTIDFTQLTCTYSDQHGNTVVVEHIPV